MDERPHVADFQGLGRWEDECAEDTDVEDDHGNEEEDYDDGDAAEEEVETYSDAGTAAGHGERLGAAQADIAAGQLSRSSSMRDTLEVVTNVTARAKKPWAEGDFLSRSRCGLEQGLAPTPVGALCSGQCYYLRSQGSICAVFKPMDEEPGTPSAEMRAGISPGEGYVREVLAYLLDHDGFCSVPSTALVRVYSRAWANPHLLSSPCSSPRGSFSQSLSPLSSSPLGLAEAFSLSLPKQEKRDSIGSRLHSLSLSRTTSSFSDPEDVSCSSTSASTSAASTSSSGETADAGSRLPAKLGSLQAYVSHHSTAEDIAPSMLSTDVVQRVAMLDVRLLNMDRHLGNILLQTVEVDEGEDEGEGEGEGEGENEARSQYKEPMSPAARRPISRRSESFCDGAGECQLRLVPIDHGLCLPKISRLGGGGGCGLRGPSGGNGAGNDESHAHAHAHAHDHDLYQDRAVVTLDWMDWPQAKEAVLPAIVTYVAALDAEADVALIRAVMPPGSVGHEECVTLRVCTVLLQTMVADGRTLNDVGAVLQSGHLRRIVQAAVLPQNMADLEEVGAFIKRFRDLVHCQRQTKP